MIRIISGTYGGANGLKTPKDPAFSLTAAEEARLVDRGVAEYVYEQTQALNGGVETADELPALPAYDISMTEKQLRGLAAFYGVDVSKVKGKKNIVAALDQFFAAEEPEDDEPDGEEQEDPDAPVLGAEEPEA